MIFESSPIAKISIIKSTTEILKVALKKIKNHLILISVTEIKKMSPILKIEALAFILIFKSLTMIKKFT